MKRFPFAKVRDFLRKFDDTFEDINWGGCAVSAAILARHLLPHVDNLKIAAYDNWRSTENNVERARRKVKHNTVRDWNAAGIAFSHVWIEFEWNGRWYALDSDGMRSRFAMHEQWGIPFEGSFTVQEMNVLTRHQRGWNPMFERDQIPAMRKYANKYLGRMLQAA